MNFPNYPGKHELPSLLTPEDLIAYRDRVGRLSNVKPRGVLFCLDQNLPRRMRWRIPAARSRMGNADVYAVRASKGRVAVLTGFGIGSPVIVALAEELAAMGATKMVVLAAGGALQSELQPGAIVVCSRAIRDEGTSHHYLPSARYVDANDQLVNHLAEAIRRRQPCVVGATWTTDAPYRETREEVMQYQVEGVSTVEMESAGLFAFGQARGVQTASIVITMDSLASLRWQAPEGLDVIRRSQEASYAAAIEVLGQP